MPAGAPAPRSSPDPDTRLRVSSTCTVDLAEIEWRFQPSGGPGGQHANKASTRAEARLDIEGSPSFTEGQRALLLERVGPSITVTVDETRSQTRNRAIALERLAERLAAGLVRPRPRRPTKPSKGSVERRLQEKKRRSQSKQGRSRPVRPDD